MGGSCDGCHGRTSSGVSDEIEHDIGIDSIDVMVCCIDWTNCGCGAQIKTAAKRSCHFSWRGSLEKEMSPKHSAKS